MRAGSLTRKAVKPCTQQAASGVGNSGGYQRDVDGCRGCAKVSNELSNYRGADQQPPLDDPGSFGAAGIGIDARLACFTPKRSLVRTQFPSQSETLSHRIADSVTAALPNGAGFRRDSMIIFRRGATVHSSPPQFVGGESSPSDELLTPGSHTVELGVGSLLKRNV
jgi:hypothetical protein